MYEFYFTLLVAFFFLFAVFKYMLVKEVNKMCVDVSENPGKQKQCWRV